MAGLFDRRDTHWVTIWRIPLAAKGFVLVVVVAAVFGESNEREFRSVFARWPQTDVPALSSRFSSWDSAHYLRLSQDGYDAGSSSCAFYPLWPAAIRTTTAVATGWPVLTSLLVANALSLVGLWLLYRLVERRCGAGVSRDSLILMLAFPGALFFSFPYTESLYLVILMLFFWGLESQRWFWVAASSFLLPLTRAVGIFIVVPLAWYLFEQWRSAALVSDAAHGIHSKNETKATKDLRWLRRLLFGQFVKPVVACEGALDANEHGSAGSQSGVAASLCHRTPKTAWLLLCPLLGYAACFGTMYAWTGNAFEGFEAQKAYPYSPSIKNMFDFPAFWSAFTNVRTLDGMMDSVLDRGFFLLFLALLPAVWKLNRTWFWYTLPTGLVPALTSYFMSYRRYIIILFPAFIVLTQLLAKGPRWMFWYYVVLLAAMQAWAVARFVNFNWAG